MIYVNKIFVLTLFDRGTIYNSLKKDCKKKQNVQL